MRERIIVRQPASRLEGLGLQAKPRLVEGEVFKLFGCGLDLFSDRVVFRNLLDDLVSRLPGLELPHCLLDEPILSEEHVFGLILDLFDAVLIELL